jgi:hypothetical protein
MLGLDEHALWEWPRGETVVGLASALKSNFRERTHENPASLPGKTTKPLTE